MPIKFSRLLDTTGKRSSSRPVNTGEVLLEPGFSDEECLKSGASLGGGTPPRTISLYCRGAVESSGLFALQVLLSDGGGTLRDESAFTRLFGLVGKEFARARVFLRRLYLVDIFICIGFCKR